MSSIERLLAGFEGGAPCGPDLEYDQQYIALESTARVKPEQQIGDTIIPAEQPDWGEVQRLAEDILLRSKDLRVAVLLTRALVRRNNLPGLCDGLTLLHGLLERYWDEVHPVPDRDDPDDIIIRMNALAPLGDPEALLLDVRNALVVVSGPHGRVSVRDILIASGKLQPGKSDTVLSSAQIESAIAGAAAQDGQLIEAASIGADLVNSIYSLLSDKVGSDRATDLRPLSGILKAVALACGSAVGVSDDPVSASDTAVGTALAEVSGARAVVAGEIRSSADAMRVLDSVCKFFELTEPGNPAPLLIRRAQRLINKSFVEIMQDLAPDSLSQIRNIAGLKDDEY